MASWVLSGAIRLLFLTTTFSSSSTSTPFTSKRSDGFLDDDEDAQMRQGSYFAVLGVAGLGDTNPHPRLEIRALEKNADQWNVYLLGLQRFQSLSQSEELSYYQIAGIHGRPYIAWDGVGQVKGGGGGYCAHGSNLFPTWHRPFLALFEEMLYLNARQVISEFPEGELKSRFNVALATFRMPYWDWAAVPPSGEGALPWSLQKPTMDVIFANGTATIPNPLYSYTFHPTSAEDFGKSPWTTWQTTMRNPSSASAEATSGNSAVALELDRTRPNLQSRVYNILAMQRDYRNISDNVHSGDSLESVHDTLHNAVGKGGHMSMLSYSAFDPIFWLHHANVDRIFALWQTINPNSYVTPITNPNPTFTTPGNSVADENTPLHPFHKDDAGSFWDSASVRSSTTFGYTYPELVGVSPNNISILISRINALYSSTAVTRSKRSPLSPKTILSAPTFSHERQYVANIKVHKFGLDGSFSVYVFLGNAPGATPGKWISEGSFVGLTGVLSQRGISDAERGFQDAMGMVPLTAALEEKARIGELASMKEDVVSVYLKAHLRWRIMKTDGTEVAVQDAPGLQISVLWADIEPAKSENEFPSMRGGYQVLMEATNGLKGGYSGRDGF